MPQNHCDLAELEVTGLNSPGPDSASPNTASPSAESPSTASPNTAARGLSHGGLRLARVSAAPLSVDEHLAAVRSRSAGAVVTFIGQVRDHDPSVTGEVTQLEYSAHPDAQQILAQIAQRHVEPGVFISVSHAVGLLNVGDLALVAVVASAHRQLAWRICQALVETIKTDVPVWKREILRDGSYHWVGL